MFLRITRFVVEVWRPSESTLGWVHMTHVCRSWRELLVDEHTLWANEIGVIPRASRRFLQRSGATAPLHIHGITGHTRDTIENFLPSERLPLQRVYTWHCLVQDRFVLARLTYLFYENALPALQKLVTCYDSRENSGPSRLCSDLELVDKAPALTSWKSVGIFFRITAPLLVHLFLVRVEIPTTALLRLLSHSPLLVSFSGIDMIFKDDNRPNASGLPANLPSLHEMYLQCLHDSAHTIYERLIAHIVHPTSTVVSLDTIAYVKSLADFELLMHYARGSSDLRWGMEIKSDWISFHASSSTSSSHHGTKTIRLANTNIENLARLLRHRSESISQALRNIQYLHLNAWEYGLPTSGDELIVELYTALSGLRALRISWPRAPLYTWAALPENHAASTGFPLPELQYWRLGPVRNGHYDLNVEAIVKWLEPRINAGIGPSTLLFDYTKDEDKNATIDPRLLALVPDVRMIHIHDDGPMENYVARG